MSLCWFAIEHDRVSLLSWKFVTQGQALAKGYLHSMPLSSLIFSPPSFFTSSSLLLRFLCTYSTLCLHCFCIVSALLHHFFASSSPLLHFFTTSSLLLHLSFTSSSSCCPLRLHCFCASSAWFLHLRAASAKCLGIVVLPAGIDNG